MFELATGRVRPIGGPDWQKQSERGWHSSQGAANIGHCGEMAVPNNCRLVVDLRSVHRD